jgi:hypothetical protein
MHEQRITDVLQDYWESKLGDNQFPSEKEINQNDIADVWPNCFLIEVDGDKFRYALLGQNIINAYADDLEGKEAVEDLLYPESPGIRDMFVELLRGRAPLYYDGALINKNNLDIKFRKLLLPLGANNEITHILGAMRWKSF